TEGPSDSPDPFECWLLSKLAQDAAGVVLEVGTWRGRSACFLGLDIPDGARLVCVDHFRGDTTGGDGADEAAAIDALARFAPGAEVVRADMLTLDWGAILHAPVDLVFYDAEHTLLSTRS